MLRDCGKGYVYSVIVSFGVIVSFCFSVFIVKGIFGVAAKLLRKEFSIINKLPFLTFIENPRRRNFLNDQVV